MSLRKAIEQVKQNIEEDRMAGKYKKGQMIVQGQWPNPDTWAKEYIIPNADGKGVRIYAKGASFKIEKLQEIVVKDFFQLRKELKDLKKAKPIAPWFEPPKEYMEHYIGREPNFTVGKLTEKDKKSLKVFRDEQRQWRKNIKEGLKKKLKKLIYSGEKPKKGDTLLTSSEIKALEPK